MKTLLKLTCLMILIGIWLAPLPVLSEQAPEQKLDEVLDRDPLEAKDTYLSGRYFEFGTDPASIALKIADALHLEGHYKDAAEMYDRWLKYYKKRDQSFKDFKKWLYYLEACIEVYKDDDRAPLKTWNEHYKKVKNENRPNKKLVTDKAAIFITEAIGNFLKSKRDEDWPGEECITLARHIGFDVESPLVLKKRLDDFKRLVRQRQTRDQVEQCNKIIRGFRRDGIPIDERTESRFANLSNYYTFSDNGKENSLTSPKEACDLFKSALTVLENANGNDTENVKCFKQSSCIKAEIQAFSDLKPSADDVEVANDLTEVARLENIRKIKEKINAFKISPLCRSFDPIDDNYLKVIGSYYSAAKALAEKPENPGPLRTFVNNYKDSSKYVKWARMAGYHLGHYYYFISADLLKTGPGKNSPTIMLQNLSSYIRSFIKYKEYVVLKDEEHMDVVKQHNALKAFREQVLLESTEAIQTANSLDGKVEKAWGVNKALDPIWKRQHKFTAASEDLEDGKTEKMEKWVKNAVSGYDKRRGSEKLLEPYSNKVSALLFTENEKDKKRTKKADWKDLQKAMALYKTYLNNAEKDEWTDEEKEYRKLSRIFGGMYDGNINEAKEDIKDLDKKVRDAWDISAEEVAKASSDDSGSFLSSIFGKKASTKTKQHSQERRKTSSTTTKKTGDIKQKKLDEANLAFEEYRYLEAWKIYGEVYPEIIPYRHMALLRPEEDLGVIKSLPPRERGILEMLARVMHAVGGQRALDQYAEEIRRECKEPTCIRRLLISSPDFKDPEVKGDFAYLAGLRDHNKGRNGSAAKFYLLAIKHLLGVSESSIGYNRVNQKIRHWTDVLKTHYSQNLVLRTKEELPLHFWRDERYEPREKVVLHLKSHGIDLGDTTPGLAPTNRNGTVEIEDRVAAFVDMVDYTIYRNERDLPDLGYFKRKFPWRKKWDSRDPNAIINNIRKELIAEIRNSKKPHLQYDLYFALAELRRIQGKTYDRFENLNIAYRAIIKDSNPENRKAKRRNIKAELSKVKNLEERGEFKLPKKGENWLNRNSLLQWWNDQNSGPTPPRNDFDQYQKTKKSADSLEGCRASAAPEQKQMEIMNVLDKMLNELAQISYSNDSESVEAKTYYQIQFLRLRGCLSKERSALYTKRFDLFLKK